LNVKPYQTLIFRICKQLDFSPQTLLQQWLDNGYVNQWNYAIIYIHYSK